MSDAFFEQKNVMYTLEATSQGMLLHWLLSFWLVSFYKLGGWLGSVVAPHLLEEP